jgi:hypothetical protein
LIQSAVFPEPVEAKASTGFCFWGKEKERKRKAEEEKEFTTEVAESRRGNGEVGEAEK